MFGFISGPCGCLTKEQNLDYRAYFCGLCNCMRHKFGLPTRMLINRDSTFLALLSSAQSSAPPPLNHRTCCNPLGKKRALFEEGAHAEFATAVTLCGLGAKLRDNAADEDWLRRSLAKLGLRYFKNGVAQAKGALEQTGFPADEISRGLFEQETLEHEATQKQEIDLGQIAEPTAQAFGAIVAHTAAVAGAPGNAPHLLEAGRSLGRLVYWADAFEDFDADVRRRRFNPLCLAGANSSAEAAAIVSQPMSQEFSKLPRALEQVKLARHGSLVKDLLLVRTPKRWAQALASEAFEDTDGRAAGRRKKKRSKKDRDSNSCWDCCLVPCDGACCPGATSGCGDGDGGCSDCGSCGDCGCDCSC